MKKLSLLVATALFIALPTNAQNSIQFSDEEVNQFFESMAASAKESCLTSVTMPDDQEMKNKIADYCACTANKVRDIFSKSDVEKIASMFNDNKSEEAANFMSEKSMPIVMECKAASNL